MLLFLTVFGCWNVFDKSLLALESSWLISSNSLNIGSKTWRRCLTCSTSSGLSKNAVSDFNSKHIKNPKTNILPFNVSSTTSTTRSICWTYDRNCSKKDQCKRKWQHFINATVALLIYDLNDSMYSKILLKYMCWANSRPPSCHTLFQIFVSPSLFSIPPPIKVFQTVPPPSRRQPPSCPTSTHQPSLHIHKVHFLQFKMIFFYKIMVAEKNNFSSNT